MEIISAFQQVVENVYAFFRIPANAKVIDKKDPQPGVVVVHLVKKGASIIDEDPTWPAIMS